MAQFYLFAYFSFYDALSTQHALDYISFHLICLLLICHFFEHSKVHRCITSVACDINGCNAYHMIQSGIFELPEKHLAYYPFYFFAQATLPVTFPHCLILFPFDFFHVITFDDITLLDVIVIFKSKSAFIALGNFFGIILESLQ